MFCKSLEANDLEADSKGTLLRPTKTCLGVEVCNRVLIVGLYARVSRHVLSALCAFIGKNVSNISSLVSGQLLET